VAANQVATNTVWSHMAGDVPKLWNGFPTKNYTQLLLQL